MGQLVRRVRHIGRIARIVLQSGQGADQIAAGVEDGQPRPRLAVRILARGEQLVQSEPSGNALVAALVKVQPAGGKQFDCALAGLLPPVSQIGRGKTAVDALARGFAGLDGCRRFGYNQSGLI